MGPQWTSMLSPWQWALLALVPPAILALYFLKLRREPLEVPSTYLWRKTIEDLRVNSLWQRLRQSLLLLLQLLLVALAMLALLRPAWRSNELTGDRFIFLIDHSASMSARDVAPTRLADAKRRALELIDRMQSGDVGLVVSFSDAAQVVQPFTDNRRALRRAVESIQPTNRTTDLTEALRVVTGLANSERTGGADDEQARPSLPASLFVLSDGNFPKLTGVTLGNLQPSYIPIGRQDAKNVGVVAFSTRVNDEKPEQLQAFARLENSGLEDTALDTGLYLNGELIDNQRIEIAAGQSTGVAFDLADQEGGVLELRAEADDALPLDDRAWAALSRPRRGRVLLVSDGNEPLELALGTGRAQAAFEVVRQPTSTLADSKFLAQTNAAQYDLVIFDRCAPPVREGETSPAKLAELMPLANTMWIGRAPPAGWSVKPTAPLPQIIDTDRAHPIMQLIEMGDVLITEATPLVPPQGAATLVSSQLGPLVAIAPREGFEDLVLGFDVFSEGKVVTNWPVRRSFPLFILNAVGYLAGGQQLAAESRTVRPGEAIALRSDQPAPKLTVVTPDNRKVAAPRGNLGAYNFTETEGLGPYTVERDGQTIERFAVNLFDARESGIRPQPTFEVGYTTIEAQPDAVSKPRDLWKWLLGAALAILLLEWYIYNRRVYL